MGSSAGKVNKLCSANTTETCFVCEALQGSVTVCGYACACVFNFGKQVWASLQRKISRIVIEICVTIFMFIF